MIRPAAGSARCLSAQIRIVLLYIIVKDLFTYFSQVLFFEVIDETGTYWLGRQRGGVGKGSARCLSIQIRNEETEN